MYPGEFLSKTDWDCSVASQLKTKKIKYKLNRQTSLKPLSFKVIDAVQGHLRVNTDSLVKTHTHSTHMYSANTWTISIVHLEVWKLFKDTVNLLWIIPRSHICSFIYWNTNKQVLYHRHFPNVLSIHNCLKEGWNKLFKGLNVHLCCFQLKWPRTRSLRNQTAGKSALNGSHLSQHD